MTTSVTSTNFEHVGADEPAQTLKRRTTMDTLDKIEAIYEATGMPEDENTND